VSELASLPTLESGDSSDDPSDDEDDDEEDDDDDEAELVLFRSSSSSSPAWRCSSLTSLPVLKLALSASNCVCSCSNLCLRSTT
jgi:hypothetical protein